MTKERATRRSVLQVGASAGALAAGFRPFSGMAAEPARRAARLVPKALRVEWLPSPVGVGTRRPRFTWALAADGRDRRNLRQTRAQVVVSTLLAEAAGGRGAVWDSGQTRTERPELSPAFDLPLQSQTDYWWSVRIWDAEGGRSDWSTPERFVTGVLDPRDWRARWIAAEPDRPVHIARMLDKSTLDQGETMPIFRRAFAVDRPVRRAFVSVCGLGQYELTVNGRPATTSVLNPGWTDYRKTLLYNTYDVSDLIHPGANVLGVMLGNGMYNVEGVKTRYTKFVGTFGVPKLILKLRLLHEDGSESVVVSDGGWSTRPGPIVFSSTYGGEDYDARRLPKDWDLPGDGAQGWSPVLEVSSPGGTLTAQGVPPIAVDRVFAAVKVSEPRPGVFVYDFGQNFAGRPALSVRGAAGATVTLTPGELLGEDGLVNQRSAGPRPNAPARFSYTLAGTGLEVWRPRFSYFGFRYVQVEGVAPEGAGAPGVPTIVGLEGEFLHDAIAQAGDFDSSDTLMVRIHELIDRAVLGNMVSVLTDCPHREKLGWLEQTHLNAPTVLYNRDAITLYEKMVRDIADAQLASGLIPEIAPEYVMFVDGTGKDTIFRDSPEWGGAIVLAPWNAYKFYGDPKVLADGYPAMARYVDYLAARVGPDGLVSYGLGDWYDVGPKPPGVAQLTSLGVTGTATYYELLTTLAHIARRLDRPPAEAAAFEGRASAVRKAFNAALFHPELNQYDRGSQTANAMPLALGFVPAGREQAVLDRLVADIRAHGWHVTAGDIGFRYVVRALMAYGRDDVLFQMMSLRTGASYGGQLARGATALTEAWDADPNHSQDHFMLGHGEAWLYGGLGGITVDFAADPERPITIAPRPVQGVASARATYRCILGEVVSDWRRDGDRLILNAQAPAGAATRIVLPTLDVDAIREQGLSVLRTPGVLGAARDPRGVALTVGSGRYRFEAPVTAGFGLGAP